MVMWYVHNINFNEFIMNNFLLSLKISPFTKILYYENLELYGKRRIVKFRVFMPYSKTQNGLSSKVCVMQ